MVYIEDDKWYKTQIKKAALGAALYQKDFWPVPLEEYIKVLNTIYDKKVEVVRSISKVADLGGKDP